MNNFSVPIRNAVRAVIVDQGRVLMQHKRYQDGSERLALPGGGQDLGETLENALRRECREEIGADIEVGALLHVADWFKPRDTEPPSTRHLVEFLFACQLPAAYIPHNGPHPDRHQIGVQWVELENLSEQPVYPHKLLQTLVLLAQESAPVYLGRW